MLLLQIVSKTVFTRAEFTTSTLPLVLSAPKLQQTLTEEQRREL